MNITINTETLTRVGLTLGGFIAGAAVAGFAVKRKYENILQEEIDSVKKAFSDAKKVDETEKPVGVETQTDIFEPEPDKSTLVVGLQYNRDNEEDRTDYAAVAEKYVEEETSIPEIILTRVDYDEDDHDQGPYVISSEQFYQEHPEYEKNTISYFVEDDTLLDDQEVIIPDPEFVVGSRAFEYFGHRSGDKNIVYIRNPEISSDFEVLRDLRSVASAIYGLEEGRGE